MAMIPMEYSGLKSATFSGTTTATGTLELMNAYDGRIPVFAVFDGSGYRSNFFRSSSGTSLYLQLYNPRTIDNTYYMSVVANTAISGTYYYLE